MTAFTGLSSNSWMSSSGTTAWNTSYDYDPNGNLLALTRNDATGTLMDNLSYRYDTASGRLLNNRLLSVDDPVNGGVGDIYDLHEYQYDEIGNLIKDESEEINSIIWDAYGKVYQIKRTTGSTKPELEFRYDAMGNRIMKIAKHGTNQEDWLYSIYSRDATGNVIAVYERKWTSTTALTSPDADLVLQVPTHPGLGSGLIGIKVNGIYLTNGPVLTETTAAGTATALANAVNAYETEQFDFTAEVDGDLVFLFTEEEYTEPLNFEILNTDVDFIGSEYFDFIAPKISGFKPHSGTFTQVPLIETVSLQELHLYGNSRLGIKTPYLEVDKRQVKSAYVGNYGNGLYLSYLDSRVISLTNSAEGPFFDHEKGLKQYELTNHLGNVLGVFGDKKSSHEGLSGEVGYYKPSLLSIHDFYPGGMPLHLRTMNVDGYRYGHNTQESDAEITGNWGSHYTAEYWMYDSRIQRRWEIDPVVKPWESGYATFDNNPVFFDDPNGDCSTCPDNKYEVQSGDNYWDLENKWGMAHGELEKMNPGVDPTKLQVGQNINVPYTYTDVNTGGKITINPDGYDLGANETSYPSQEDNDVMVYPSLTNLLRGYAITYAYAFGSMGLAQAAGIGSQLSTNAANNIWNVPTGVPRYPIPYIQNPYLPVQGPRPFNPPLPTSSPTSGRGFNSFYELKKFLGPAGPNKAWHHIVEQTPGNIAKFGAPKIQNTANVIKLDHGTGTIHNRISAHYSSKQFFTNGQTVRQWLSTQSYEQQYNYGMRMLKQFGWNP